MKELVLVRHAKSSWKHNGLEDCERPLNGRGRRDGPVMAERFSRQPHKPGLVISSYATRALTTARVFCDYLRYPIEQVRLSEQLYEASVPDILEVLHGLDDRQNCVMLFGHNPGFTDLINYFTTANLENLPTAGVAVVALPIERWQQVVEDGVGGKGKLAYYSFPKQV